MIVTYICGFILFRITLVLSLPQTSILHEASPFLLSDRGPSSRRCVYDKIHNMLYAGCIDLNLHEIPSNLHSDVQILDFSGNRLRKLTDDTLSSFTSLAYLYLMDNFIVSIGDNAFSRLKYLQVLDMTKNALRDFPKNILAHTHLKKLLLGENVLGDMALNSTPYAIESNIEYLELSQNQMTKLPKFGYLSQLKYLNVSKNKIKTITASEIAMFCSLETLDISDNPLIENCNCPEINSWINSRKIKMTPAKLKCHSCSTQSEYGPITNETIKIFQNCLSVIKEREERVRSRTVWIIVISCIIISLVCVFTFLYCMRKRNRKRKMKSKNKKELTIKNAESELLNEKHLPERL